MSRKKKNRKKKSRKNNNRSSSGGGGQKTVTEKAETTGDAPEQAPESATEAAEAVGCMGATTTARAAWVEWLGLRGWRGRPRWPGCNARRAKSGAGGRYTVVPVAMHAAMPAAHRGHLAHPTHLSRRPRLVTWVNSHQHTLYCM